MIDGLINNPDVGQLLEWAKSYIKDGKSTEAIGVIETIIDKGWSEVIAKNIINNMISLLEKCPESTYRDIVCARAFSLKGEQNRALGLLASLYYNAQFNKESDALQEKLIAAFLYISKRYDTDWYRILNDKCPRNLKDRSNILLKRFYFGGAAVDTPCGKKVVNVLREFSESQRIGKTITANDYYIKFLKIFSSATPIMKSKRIHAVGGGYFLALGGYGCVIDPGHHFLDNFFDKNHSIDDVSAIIVTHFHDDHYADLPSLMSLLFRRWGKTKTISESKISLFCDQVTRKRFKDLIDFSRNYIECVELDKHLEPIVITQDIILHTLPTSHNVFGRRDTGVGLAFEIPECGSSLVITGDTAWTSELERAYFSLKNRLAGNIILVPHISSISEKEMPLYIANSKGFHDNHLCLHGLCKAIEALEPHTVLLSEVGEELESVIDRIARLIKEVYEVNDCRWCRMGEEYPLLTQI